MKIRTWYFEALVVLLTLVVITASSRSTFIEWVGALAVMFTFLHLQVSMRHAEAAAAGVAANSVDCHRWGPRYHIGKELLWCVYFVAHRSWIPLISVGVFVIYPYWRTYWRRRYPLV